jgi:hypothetical protein
MVRVTLTIVWGYLFLYVASQPDAFLQGLAGESSNNERHQKDSEEFLDPFKDLSTKV